VKVAFVSYRRATAEGDGGNHRTHQILRDLQAAFGCDNVSHISLEAWATRAESWQSTPGGRLGRARQRLTRMMENPYNLLTRQGWSRQAGFGTRGVLPRQFCQQYVEHTLRQKPLIGVVDHPLLDQIRAINARAGVSTIITTHNIESLDVSRMQFKTRVATQRIGVDFGNELWSLSHFAERLTISKVEAAILNGVGLSCEFYPYVPCGEVRERLQGTAVARAHATPDPRLFLLMGTAFHAPTRRSLEWFVDHAARQGLPKHARVVLVGSHVDEIAPRGSNIPGLDVRGKISDCELTDLLTRTGTALVPQRMGFGALTRIPELSCAGVPSLVSAHASQALDLPPGARVLRDSAWCALTAAMRQSMDAPSTIDPDSYREWETRQQRPLATTLRDIADR
jgi:hypothetical protein